MCLEIKELVMSYLQARLMETLKLFALVSLFNGISTKIL